MGVKFVTGLYHSSVPCFKKVKGLHYFLFVLKILWPTLKVWNGLLTGWEQISIFLFFLRELDLCCEKLSLSVTTICLHNCYNIHLWFDTYLTSLSYAWISQRFFPLLLLIVIVCDWDGAAIFEWIIYIEHSFTTSFWCSFEKYWRGEYTKLKVVSKRLAVLNLSFIVTNI